MVQYIDKTALVAEIDKAINGRNDWQLDKYRNGYHDALTMLKKYLSTLKVKEVDFEKELDSMITPELKFHKALPSLFDVAKHFFELGMCTANPLTVKDIEKIYHLVNEVSDDLGVRAIYVNIYQETLKRFKAQKGE